jgi:hypothetical protein
MGGYTRDVSGQRLGKHIPVARQQILNNGTVGLCVQQWKNCFLRGPCQDVISIGQDQSLVNSVRESVKRRLESEAEK